MQMSLGWLVYHNPTTLFELSFDTQMLKLPWEFEDNSNNYVRKQKKLPKGIVVLEVWNVIIQWVYSSTLIWFLLFSMMSYRDLPLCFHLKVFSTLMQASYKPTCLDLLLFGPPPPSGRIIYPYFTWQVHQNILRVSNYFFTRHDLMREYKLSKCHSLFGLGVYFQW